MALAFFVLFFAFQFFFEEVLKKSLRLTSLYDFFEKALMCFRILAQAMSI